MKDILLDSDGDIFIGENSDISLKQSVRQEVKIRLQWFFAEWRFAPEFGMPYFEEILVKNPIKEKIMQIIREEAAKVAEVKQVRNIIVDTDHKTRSAAIKFTVITDYGTFTEEVKIT